VDNCRRRASKPHIRRVMPAAGHRYGGLDGRNSPQAGVDKRGIKRGTNGILGQKGADLWKPVEKFE